MYGAVGALVKYTVNGAEVGHISSKIVVTCSNNKVSFGIAILPEGVEAEIEYDN